MANGIYDLISKGIQDAKNYASIPATYAAGLYGNYINKNVGENMARSFRTDEMNERLSQQVGDQLSPGVNSGSLTYTDFGLPAGVSRYLGDGKFEPTRNFTAPTFKETMNVNSADLANAYTIGNLNFNRNPSGDINYTGNTYDFPQPTFMNNNPMDIPLDELNVNAPEFRFTDYLQGKYGFNKFEELPSAGIAYSELDDFEAQNAGSFIPKEEKGILSLRDILADLGRKGVEGFKDLAGRGIKSKVYGGIGTLAGGPVVGTIAALAGLLTGGDLFNAPYIGAGNLYDGAGGFTAAQLDQQNARGGYYSDAARNQRRNATRVANLITRAESGKNFSRNNLKSLGGFTDEQIDNIVGGSNKFSPGTFTAASIDQSFAGEEGPTGNSTTSGNVDTGNFEQDGTGRQGYIDGGIGRLYK